MHTLGHQGLGHHLKLQQFGAGWRPCAAFRFVEHVVQTQLTQTTPTVMRFGNLPLRRLKLCGSPQRRNKQRAPVSLPRLCDSGWMLHASKRTLAVEFEGPHRKQGVKGRLCKRL